MLQWRREKRCESFEALHQDQRYVPFRSLVVLATEVKLLSVVPVTVRNGTHALSLMKPKSQAWALELAQACERETLNETLNERPR